MNQHPANGCRGLHRRTFLADVGMGFTGLALGAMLARSGFARGRSSCRRLERAERTARISLRA